MNLMNYIKITNIAGFGLTVLCLTMFLSGCGSKPCPEFKSCSVPVVYLQHVPEPRLNGRTNADLAAWSLNLLRALRQANNDKAGLREWLSIED